MHYDKIYFACWVLYPFVSLINVLRDMKWGRWFASVRFIKLHFTHELIPINVKLSTIIFLCIHSVSVGARSQHSLVQKRVSWCFLHHSLFVYHSSWNLLHFKLRFIQIYFLYRQNCTIFVFPIPLMAFDTWIGSWVQLIKCLKVRL